MGARLLLFCLTFGFTAFGQSSHDDVTASANHLLTSFVVDGKVDYQTISQIKSKLDGLVDEMASIKLDNLEQDEQKTFLINSYNVFVIKQVVDHYPISSPQEIPNFFTERKFDLVGFEDLSLNDLEKEVLLSKFPDPRLHFALVCAAEGCPKLRSEAYFAERLEEQLMDQVKKTLENPSFLNYDEQVNELHISKIFEWYAPDFGHGKKERLEFINSYLAMEVPNDAKFVYNRYDWSLNSKKNTPDKIEKSNLQLFTPSALFNKGEFEVNVFNSIYSQQRIRDANGENVDLGQTQNFFTSMIMLTTGLSDHSRFNVGLDLYVSKARTAEGDASALDIFGSSEAIFNKTLVSYIAPRVKLVPFRNIPRLSVQSALWIPVSNELESEGFVAHDRYTWFTQVFFDKSLGTDFQLFLEADLLYRFTRSESQRYDFFRTPVSAFVSYFPTSRSTIFAFSQYSPRFETRADTITGTEEFGLTQWFAQFGVGGKYQISDALGIEVSYSDFALSKSEGAGHTLNFGLRYIHR